MENDAEHRAYDALSQQGRLTDLTDIAHALMATAVEQRREAPQPERIALLAGERKLTREDATTPFGNALDVLERGPEDPSERALVRALAAHAVARHPPQNAEEEERAIRDLLWLATHTSFDATGLLDRALGESAAKVWAAVAERIRRIDQGAIPALGHGEAIVAAAALASSGTPEASTLALALAGEVTDQKLARVLGGREPRAAMAPIAGESTSAPRGPLATALLGLTGLLLFSRVVELVGRVVLAYRSPAEITLSAEGDVRIRWRIELLGRTLRDRDVVIVRASLVSAAREVRFAGLSLYAGLLALALGSYVGVSAFVDGVRAASPALLVAGVGVAAAGLALDFVLSCVAPAARGRCRMQFVPREGRVLCVGRVPIAHADALLARLAGH
jgi:hypothetical protein